MTQTQRESLALWRIPRRTPPPSPASDTVSRIRAAPIIYDFVKFVHVCRQHSVCSAQKSGFLFNYPFRTHRINSNKKVLQPNGCRTFWYARRDSNSNVIVLPPVIPALSRRFSAIQPEFDLLLSRLLPWAASSVPPGKGNCKGNFYGLCSLFFTLILPQSPLFFKFYGIFRTFQAHLSHTRRCRSVAPLPLLSISPRSII